jgi:hypothetical protein
MASYLERSLGDGETIIARARFPWFYGAAAWAALLAPAIALLIFAAGARQEPVPFALSDPKTLAAILAGLLTLVGLWIFIAMMVKRATTEIGITSHRFVEKHGLLTMHSSEISLPNIEGVKVEQSLAGRILGYGTVRIEGTGVDAVTTPDIADPVGFVRAIQTAKEHAARL